MATGAVESWVAGRPRRKEGSHGAISSSGCTAWSRKPQAKPGAEQGSRFPLDRFSWGRTTPPPSYPPPLLLQTPISFGGEGKAAPHCGQSHILQSRGGGSKKQNKQNHHRRRPWGERPGYLQLMCHQEVLSTVPAENLRPLGLS